MKICSIRIKGYHQFQDTFLDFTNPETGQPLDKICFIGRNGTGKSKLLALISELLKRIKSTRTLIKALKIEHILIKFYTNDEYFYLYTNPVQSTLFENAVASNERWFDNLIEYYKLTGKIDNFSPHQIPLEGRRELRDYLQFTDNSSDLLIFSPSESQSNSYIQVDDVPSTSLDEALKLFRSFPYYNLVSDTNVQEFWKMLIFLSKKRDNEREVFENRPENLKKTKEELIVEFEKENPKILYKLADLWNRILNKTGLEFDVENASNPIQLSDNLRAYIRLRGSKERIKYNQLSTGIRNFIFRVGHIYSLYFNREIKRGFLLLDEPENSLFPDFLFDLIETYRSLMIDKNNENNTQFFVSTHNPIIAAQFAPHERVILEWDENGFVKSIKGSAPIGDDPNDLLRKDFKLKHLMGKEGQEMWEEYLELRKQLRRTKDTEKQKDLMSRINKIGTDYNFEN